MMAMTDPLKNKDLWNSPASNEKQDSKKSKYSARRSGIITIALTAVIIVCGFMLPNLLYPFLDSYSDALTLLESPADDTVSSHVFEEPVTLYPWNVYDGADETQLRSLSPYELSVLEQNGVADLLVNNLQLRGMQLESDYSDYTSRILSEFYYLDSLDSSQANCFVLVDADIDQDGVPDVRCAADTNGKLISLLYVSNTWTNLQLTAPLAIPPEQIDESTVNVNETGEATGSDGAGDSAEAGGMDDAAGGAATAQTDYPTRPAQEEENIWQFSYVISREALQVGQTEVYSVFRQLDLDFEARFGYPFVNLIPVSSENAESEQDTTEFLPEVEQISMTTHQLATGSHLLRIYDFSGGVRLILYINYNTEYCDGFSLSMMPP